LGHRLQQGLFPHLEECRKRALTGKEDKLVLILELVVVEKYIPKRHLINGGGGKFLNMKRLSERL
jgi:hypothetical protein